MSIPRLECYIAMLFARFYVRINISLACVKQRGCLSSYNWLTTTLYIEVSVPRHENTRSCIHVCKWYLFCLLFTIFLLEFRNVPTEWFFSFFLLLHIFVCFQFESRSGQVYLIQHYVIKFVSDLRHVGGFLQVLRFPSPIELTATIQLEYY